MNSKVYRLLRDNKEQGPYTSEELIQKGFKPFDLIWVDGRSAAWSYPAEIAEFKIYMPEEKKGVDILTKKKETPQVSASIQAAVAMNDNIVEIKQKPRYKVSAAWSKIQTITAPLQNDVIIAAPKKTSSAKIIDTKRTGPVNTKSLSWEQAWLDWEHEKKISVLLKPVQAFTATASPKKQINKAVDTVPVLEKKFEQSLDSITDKYIDNLVQKKKAKGFSPGKSSEFILPSIALIIIFSIGYWLLHNTKTATAVSILPAKQEQAIQPKNNEQTSLSLNADIPKNGQSTLAATSAQQETGEANPDEPVATSAAKEKIPVHYSGNAKFIAPGKNVVTANANNISANKTVQPSASGAPDIDLKKAGKPVAKQFDPSVINHIPNDNAYNDPALNNHGDLNAAENRPVRRRTNADDISNNQPVNNAAANNATVTKKANTKSGANYVSVPEYITMNNGNGSVKIQNVSDDDLDLVVVDVQYFDVSGHYRKGETLYLHNLRAGKAVTVKTPRDLNSSYATSKVSLVSSDANGVYAVGDN